MTNLRLRYKILAVMSVLIGVFLYGRCNGLRSVVPHTVLPVNDREQIIVNPGSHQLIIVKPTGNETLTLPDHPSVIDVHKDGTVSVMSPQYGWEHKAFFGLHASDKLRLAIGMDGYYFKKLDFGIGLATQLGPYTPIAFGQVSYTFYDNCRVGAAYGTNRYIGGTLTVRI